MKIGPVDNPDRPGGPENKGPRRHDVRPDPERKEDSVDISDSARSLAEQSAAKESHETTSSDRIESLREVSEMDIRLDKVERARRRAESGYYDRPEVRQEIARRITDDFMA